MKATVYFLQLSETQIAEINTMGWDCELGKDYLEARFGRRSESAMKLFVPAAELNVKPDSKSLNVNDKVWTRLQNIIKPWTENKNIKKLAALPRSMDVGDIIVWENGDKVMVAGIGFKPAPDFVIPS